jgi:hypothetical protein
MVPRRSFVEFPRAPDPAQRRVKNQWTRVLPFVVNDTRECLATEAIRGGVE